MACHCNDCQKFSGAPFRAVAVIAADDVKISGRVNEFLKIVESGNAWLQDFCRKLGSHAYWRLICGAVIQNSLNKFNGGGVFLSAVFDI